MRLSRSNLTLVVILASVIVASFYSPGYDWILWFRPACLEMIAGRSPYDLSGFYNPPWVLLPMMPLAFLPERAGVVVMTAAYLLSMIYVATRLGAQPVTVLLLLFSPSVI